MFKPKEGEIPKNLWGWKWVLIGGIFVASIAGLFIYRIQGVGPDAKIWPTQDESQFKLETEHQRKASTDENYTNSFLQISRYWQ